MKEKRVVTMLTKMFQFIFKTVVVQTRRGMPAQKRRLAMYQTLEQGFAQQHKNRQSLRRRKRARKIIRDFLEWLAFDGKENWYACNR